MRLGLVREHGYRFCNRRTTIEGYYKSEYVATYCINTKAYGFMHDRFNNIKLFII
jgi:hypothetical protein